MIEVTNHRAKHMLPGAGESVWVLGDLYTFKAVSEDTNGTYATWETVAAPGSGPPPHIHHREDESFYILEGEVEFRTGDETTRAGAGAFVHIPKGTLHTFKAVGAGPARFLTTVVPGGFERFFLEAGDPAVDPSPPPVSDAPPDMAKFMALAAELDCEIPQPPAG